MGVVNVTPDSFSDGGEYFDAERAIAHGASSPPKAPTSSTSAANRLGPEPRPSAPKRRPPGWRR